MIDLLVLLEALPLGSLTAGFGAALTAFAAAMGIGRIGVSTMESIARQPEAAGDLRSGMIVSAALIEGVSFFAVVVNLLILFL